MSDTSSAFPPPPPGNIPPPAYHQAASTLPNYQPPPISNPAFQPPPAVEATIPYGALPPGSQPWQQQLTPWQQAQMAAQPGANPAWGIVGILGQFEPPAMWSILVGLATVIAPFFLGIFFLWLPVVGAVMGFRAIKAGQLIGGLVGICLSGLGGMLTIGFFVARVSGG